MVVSGTIKGSDALNRKLEDISKGIKKASKLRVGFLEDAKYPDGTQVALVAAIQNFGAPSRGIPPRPFFSNMVRDKSPEWPKAISNLLIANNYDTDKTLHQAGEAIAGQLRQSIIDTNEPPLSPATIKKKGFAKPLIDTGVMIHSISYEVDDT